MNVNFENVHFNRDFQLLWNIKQISFVGITTKDGEFISDTIYSLGGLWTNPTEKTKYVLIIKHTPNYGKRIFIRNWCILNENGDEKVLFDGLDTPYLIKNSQMFFYNGGVWNIETNTLISKYDGSIMESNDYLFLNNLYDKDVTRRGVWKICKRTCAVELFFIN